MGEKKKSHVHYKMINLVFYLLSDYSDDKFLRSTYTKGIMVVVSVCYALICCLHSPVLLNREV